MQGKPQVSFPSDEHITAQATGNKEELKEGFRSYLIILIPSFFHEEIAVLFTEKAYFTLGKMSLN